MATKRGTKNSLFLIAVLALCCWGGLVSPATAAPDDVVLNLGSEGTFVRLNDSDWGFLDFSSVGLTGQTPNLIATGDIDGNGQDDIILSFPGAGLYVSRNLSPLAFLHGTAAAVLAIGDIDGGGRDDLFISFSGLQNNTWIYKNDTDFEFLDSRTVQAAGIGDIDNNGQDDIMMSFTGQVNNTWIYRNDTAFEFVHGASARTIVMGNLDGILGDDVFISFEGLQNNTWVYRNDTAFGFLDSRTIQTAVVGDIDGILGDDVILSFTGQVNNTWIYRNDSTFTFLHGRETQAMATGDMDQTGKDELIVSFPGNVTWLYRNDTAFSVLHTTPALNIATGDVDGSTLSLQILSVSKTGTGSGAVTSNPGGINCGNICTEVYNSGTSVTLSATPAFGSIFDRWIGCGLASSSTDNCTFTITSDKTVTAVFNTIPVQTFTLSVSVIGDGTGTVTGSGINCVGNCIQTYDSGTSVTLTAMPDSGSTFNNQWSGCGLASSDFKCRITMNSNKNVTATFNATLVEKEFLAVLDNLMAISTLNSTLENTVFRTNQIAVGCDFSILPAQSASVCHWSALWFDVVPTISGKTILEAKLILHVGILPADTTDPYRVSAFAGGWNSFTITAKNFPDTFIANRVTFPAPFTGAFPVEVDVTATVRKWADASWPDNGFLLSPTNVFFPDRAFLRTTDFHSMDLFDFNFQRPRLFIRYQ